MTNAYDDRLPGLNGLVCAGCRYRQFIRFFHFGFASIHATRGALDYRTSETDKLPGFTDVQDVAATILRPTVFILTKCDGLLSAEADRLHLFIADTE